MKTVIGTILLLLVFLLMTGCSDEEHPTVIEAESTEQGENIGCVIELFEVSKDLASGTYLGSTRSALSIPSENLFMEGENAFGFDQLAFLGIDGSMTMLTQDNRVQSCTFSTDACKEKSILRANLDRVNQYIADILETQKTDLDFICTDKTSDEYDALFSGKGILKAEYDADKYSVTLSVVGANNEAMISIVIQSR